MKNYLVIDAMINGTGIRDKYEGGSIQPDKLGLSIDAKKRLKIWLIRYWKEFYHGFNDKALIEDLDKEGRQISLMIKKEIPEAKIEYFSDALMTTHLIEI
jgi:hypothetical protein